MATLIWLAVISTVSALLLVETILERNAAATIIVAAASLYLSREWRKPV